MTQSKTPRTIRARRLLTLGTAAVGLAAPAVSGTPPVGAGYPNPYHISDADSASASIVLASSEGEGEGEGEGEAKRLKLLKGEGEGEGDEAHAEGEGEAGEEAHAEAEGEGEAGEEAHAEGEGEGEAGEEAHAEGEGEGEAGEEAHAEGEGEGEGEEAHAEAEGEGEAAPAAAAEGESEGGSSEKGDAVTFQRDMGFMAGHLRAGLALYELGDLEAAKTHMGHPIEEKYEAVAEELEEMGRGELRGDIEALAAAVERDAELAEVQGLFDTVITNLEGARDQAGGGPRARLLALAGLTRIAAEEYAVGTKDGKIANLHEYQDSWGFLRSVEAEAQRLSQDGNADVAKAAGRILELVGELDTAYGDMQGLGEMNIDPSLLYGAAARMELAAMAVR
ncbi:hypothetical protein BV394_12410 [Brevirhabdus pacifica]|uniref:Uncharacterized protein n=1 Tax=Brevirhabdus pacifica TaxID=1267768 RepID=A0A1U7DKD4_9RHOB|nr:hypothetical protein [Brevirhabdus pacifica]APX90431.1 hypothetical protein BV394_12410 [Brevirhabdus pacifica]OWU78549.1 hypothetical protein ATO5_07055 [Loktanella sp. 22II-4b]PJJ85472.1 hypothetical protein CLV77_2342 [Brevirhabdus pacifica]